MTNEERDHQARLNYNRLCFILNCFIRTMDSLQDSNQYRHAMKQKGNQLLKEAEQICNTHQWAFCKFGTIDNEGVSIDAEDVFNITDDAYERLINFFVTREPNHIVSVMTLLERLEEKDPDFLNKIEAPFTPVAK